MHNMHEAYPQTILQWIWTSSKHVNNVTVLYLNQILTMIQICLIRAWKIIYLKHLSSKIKLPPLFHLVFTYFSFVSILYESWQIDIPMLMCTLEEVCWFLFKMAGCQQSQINILKLDLVCHQIFINDDLHRLIKFVYKTKH